MESVRCEHCGKTNSGHLGVVGQFCDRCGTGFFIPKFRIDEQVKLADPGKKHGNRCGIVTRVCNVRTHAVYEVYWLPSGDFPGAFETCRESALEEFISIGRAKSQRKKIEVA